MARPPHILVFFSDDHGPWAMGCAGNHELHTPSMDHLAATGVYAPRAFTPCPVCSPARASFWTGRFPSAHGIHDYLASNKPELTKDHPGIRGQENLAQALQAAGYQTGICGKWHCHHDDQPAPGFDTWFIPATGTNARFGPQPFFEGTARVEHHGHQAPFITERALRFLRERDPERPFFLFVGYADTHTPHQGAPERLVAKYEQATFDDLTDETFPPDHGFVRNPFPPKSDPHFHRVNAEYYAAVEMIDQQVGRVLDELDSLGLRDDTCVIYTGDHGHNNGTHGIHCKGNATVPQNFFDESIGVPFVASWPGHFAAGHTIESRCDHTDLHATLRELAGLDPYDRATEQHRPGESLLAELKGDGDPGRRPYQVSEYGNARMIRTGAWKYIQRFPGRHEHYPDELYDLARDPRETTNVAAVPANAAVIAELRTTLDDFFARWERPETSGKRVLERPAQSDWQPWDLTPEIVAARQQQR